MQRSKTERALIGLDQQGVPIILATDGPWIASDCENIATGAEDVGLVDAGDFPHPGLYLWEGYGHLVNGGAWDGPVEPEVEYVGTLRMVMPEEVAELYKMKPPEEEEPQCPTS
jgi:hypothetical protein